MDHIFNDRGSLGVRSTLSETEELHRKNNLFIYFSLFKLHFILRYRVFSTEYKNNEITATPWQTNFG